MSSANCGLVIFLPPMLTFPSCSSRASNKTRSRKMLKRVGGRRHPCLTPSVDLNHSPMLPFIWTALEALSKSCSMVRTRFALILYFRMVANKVSVRDFFEINEDMVRILLMLTVLFTDDSKVRDLFCGAPSSSEPSLFFSNYLFSLGFKSRLENPQKLTQLSPRSHPRHLVGKRTAQEDAIKDITSNSQVNSYFPYRWSPASLTINIYFYLFVYLYIT